MHRREGQRHGGGHRGDLRRHVPPRYSYIAASGTSALRKPRDHRDIAIHRNLHPARAHRSSVRFAALETSLEYDTGKRGGIAGKNREEYEMKDNQLSHQCHECIGGIRARFRTS